MDNTINRNLAMNVLSVITSLVVPIIMLPYLVRTLGVETYGQMKYAMSLVSYMTLFATLGIPAYGLHKGSKYIEDKAALNIFLSQLVAIEIGITTIATIIFVLIINKVPLLHDIKLLLVILVIESIISVVTFVWIFQIYEYFHILSMINIVSQWLLLIMIFIVVRNNDDVILYGLIILCVAIIKLLISFSYTRKYFRFKIALKGILLHFRPLLYFFIISLAYRIYIDSDIVIIGIILGNEAVGLYSVAAKIYFIIKQLYSSIIVVIVPRVNRLVYTHNIKNAENITTDIWNVVIWLLLPTSMGLFFVAKELVYFVAGLKLLEAVQVLKILSISLVFAVLSNVYANIILIPNGKEKLVSLAMIIAALINLILNITLIPNFGVIIAAVSTLLSEAIIYLILFVASLGVYKPTVYSKNICLVFLGITTIVGVHFIVESWNMSYVLNLLMKCGLSIFIYFCLTVFFYYNDLLRIISKK